MKLSDTLRNIVTNQRVLFWFFIIALSLPGVFMFYTESTGNLTRTLGIALPLALYWAAMTLPARPGKAYLWLFFFAFLDAFQLVLLYLYGESPIAVDMFLNVLTTNPTEAGEVLGQIWPAVLFVVIVYGGGLALAVVSLRCKATLPRPWRLHQRQLALVLLVFGVGLTVVNCVTDRRFRIENDIFPINGCYNLGFAIDRAWRAQHFHENSRDFTYQAADTRRGQPQVMVLVIGETARADNFGLYGYSRNTTPLLGALGNNVVAYRDAISMSNTTHKSVPLLLTSVGSQPDYDSIYCQKGVISAFRQAGYQTAFLSNQRRNHSLIDFMGEEAEHVTFIKDTISLTAIASDEGLLPVVRRELARRDPARSMLLVVHCYGSHFNYRDRYLKGTGFYTPDYIPEASKKYRQRMINAYDNTIRHTDIVLAGIIRQLQAQRLPAALIYVSDHGEDIYDDERGRFLHASPLPTYYQLRVPFLVWTSSQFQQAHPGQWQQVQAHSLMPISTNRVCFHTLVDLAGLRVNRFSPTDAVSNPAFTPKPRRYVNDHNQFRAMDDCGLKRLDEQQFRRHALQFP